MYTLVMYIKLLYSNKHYTTVINRTYRCWIQSEITTFRIKLMKVN